MLKLIKQTYTLEVGEFGHDSAVVTMACDGAFGFPGS